MICCYYFKHQISNYYLPSATTVFTSLFATDHKNKFTVQRPIPAVYTATLNSLLLEINSRCNVQNPIFKLHYLIFYRNSYPTNKKKQKKKTPTRAVQELSLFTNKYAATFKN
jgi:hypothetical protein